MNRKGIILAGGLGSRLYPVTLSTSKQLLPVYDKPMIYYPLSTLMLCGINDICIISTPDDIENYKKLLEDGSQFGISINYLIQPKPNGLADAFLIAEKFIDNKDSVLILGDNIFYGHDLYQVLQSASNNRYGATAFAYHVSDPERYGVVEMNKNGLPIKISEKPSKPKSNFAITGIYFVDKNAYKYCKSIKPSKRGELEITDLLNIYMKKNLLNIEILKRGYAWLDTGTHDSLLSAGQFISTIEKRQGLKVACPEEIAYRNRWITKKQLKSLSKKYENNSYGKYLINLMSEKDED